MTHRVKKFPKVFRFLIGWLIGCWFRYFLCLLRIKQSPLASLKGSKINLLTDMNLRSLLSRGMLDLFEDNFAWKIFLCHNNFITCAAIMNNLIIILY